MSQALPNEAVKWGRMLALVHEDSSVWLPGELAQIWRHQLGAPLEVELGESWDQRCGNNVQPPAPRTVGDLLSHPAPPRTLLLLVQRLAADRRAQDAFPAEIATALYFATAAVALTRLGERVTELDDAALRRGFHWATCVSWLDPSTRSVLETALGGQLIG
jgi:hypothetical protein